MKKYLIVSILLLAMGAVFAQTKVKEKEPTQSEINKMIEDATKGMSAEEKAEIEKMMKGVMPELTKKPGSEAVAFTDNKKLVPARDINRINRIPKKIFTDADVSANSVLLYTKLMTKIPASEKAIITGVMEKSVKGSVLMEAAITSFMQGHNKAAMGLALKAVQAEPKNANHQNNLAAILSQSGYPEKAIPYLKKLSAQDPANSTVLHNLGYAWLCLGQIDTARSCFAKASVSNPNNPETKICRGVLDEINGDLQKAAENYKESFEDSPNPFTENLAKNVDAGGQLENMDFDKMKSRIFIYEYFKKDWITIPKLADKVTAYESNMKIKNGYSKMFTAFDDKIASMSEASSKELEALADKDINVFAETMMNESVKGISMMSMPAVYMQKVLTTYIKNWTEKFQKEYGELMTRIDAQRIIMTDFTILDKCHDIDRKNNEFLAYANPQIRSIHAKKIEEFRVWLNAFCTWSWYITGNPKNTILTQCIDWTGFMAEMYRLALADQFAIAPSCVHQDGYGSNKISMPTIPDFTCPAEVTFPVGMDELQLNSEAANFDKNDWNIKQEDGASIPNVTLAMGIEINYVTEPGKYGNPYIKTGNGSINSSGINGFESDDPELMPLDPAYLDIGKKLAASDYKKIRNAELTRKLLKDMMKTNCSGDLPKKKKRKNKFEVGLGELVLEPIPVDEYGIEEKWDEKLNVWVNSKGEYRYPNGLEVGLGELVLEPVIELGLGELEMWDDDMQAWINSKGEKRYEPGFKEQVVEDVKDALEGVNNPQKNSKFEVGLGELELWDDDMQAWIDSKGGVTYEPGFKDKLVSDVRDALETSGLQTTISNGLDGIKAMESSERGLFD